MVDPEVKKFIANCRPVGMGTCESCGREHVTIYRNIGVKDTQQCLECWKEKRESVPPPPEPVRRIVVAQETLTEVLERLKEVERRLGVVEADLTELRRKRLRG